MNHNPIRGEPHGEVRTKRAVSEQDDSSQRLLIEIKDDGEPVQSATVTVSIQLEDGLHEPILDLRQKTAEPSKKTGRITLYLILSLASVSVLSLVTFLILAVKCMRNSRSSGTCCMRRSGCDDYKNPNRNLQIQLNTDGPIKYVEVLGGDMLSQSQSFRSCMSPMSEYSDFTLIKPSSTTDFKEVISVLDASLPDSTWTFESQQFSTTKVDSDSECNVEMPVGTKCVGAGEVRTKRAVSEQDDSSQRLLIEIKDDGEPVQSATVTVSIQLEDGLHEPILDLRQKAAEPSKKTGRITLYLILSLASVSVLSLVTFLILAVKCMRNSRSSGTCCMRRSDCDDYKNPNRNLQIQLNTDGPIKYVEVLGGDMLSQSQSFRSCMSPMSEYSDFTLIKPSSTTDFKEVISVLDASLPDSTWTFESQQTRYSIPEELKQGSVVGNLAKDLGLGLSDIFDRKMHVASESGEQYFSVDAGKGELVLDVEDINDNAPEILLTSRPSPVREDAPSGTAVALISARDLDSGEVRTKRAVSEQDDSSQRLLIEIKDDGEPVQSATVTVSIQLEDGLHEPILDLRQKATEPSKKTGRITLYLILSLASVSVLSLVTFLILAVKCMRNSRSSGTCCMRRSDCDDYKNPNRNLQIQLNTDGPIKYVEVLGGDMLSQSQSFRSCMSPMSEYSDFTLIKPSSTTDFKEVISVLDASLPDSTWTFESQQTRYSIPEELEQGSVVGNLAKDLGLGLSDIFERKLRVASEAGEQYFSVDAGKGELVVNDRIDREALCGQSASCVLPLQVVIENPLQLHRIEVEIRDVNDNAPSFLKNDHILEIAESIVVGVRFPLESAEDPDVGSNGLKTYTLSKDECFTLKVKEIENGRKIPELVLNKSLDREKKSVHNLFLTAMDGGNPVKSGTSKITVNVLDINDNVPIFENTFYKIAVQENSVNGSFVIATKATDIDEGPNGEIEYSLGIHTPPSVLSLFHIDAATGEIFLKNQLDHETQASYRIDISAKDKGLPKMEGHCSVQVDVLDVNDNAPEIVLTSKPTSVPEDSRSGTVVALLGVRDLDSGNNGEVRTKRAVSEQDDSSQRLLIEIKDDGEPVQSATVTVSIQLEDGLHEPILDLRQKVVEPSKKTGRITLYLILSLASVSVLSLVTFLILAVKCMRNSRSSGTCCMRRSDCDDYKNPNRNLQIQLNTDGPIKYVEVLGGDMLSQSQSFRSCMSPMSEYSDFTLIKPSSTTDFKEVISVLDASLPDSTWTFESQQDDSSQRLLIEIKDDGEPVQSATVTVSIQLEDGLHEPILDLRQKAAEPSKKTGRITLYLILSLASVSVLSLVTFLILAVKCMRNSRSSGTCCMRRSDCDDYKNPNRNLQIQLNTDGPIKYVEVLGGDLLSQSQSFRSCMSPMSEYSDFTLIKPSSTTDFKEVISVLDASLPDSTWTFESQQDDSSQRLLIEIKDDGEPVQSATVTVSIQLEDGLHEPILDLRQKAAEPSKKTGRITLYLILSLASVSVLSLVTFLILAVKCMRNSRSSGTCCMRRSDCDDYKNPNRNLQIQLNTDGPIKYVEVLGGDMLSQSQSFRSCMSPMSEYSDFTLIKPSSTTDFKEVISVLDASLPDSTWTFESQQDDSSQRLLIEIRDDGDPVQSATVTVSIQLEDGLHEPILDLRQKAAEPSKKTGRITLYLILSLASVSVLSLVTFLILAVKCMRNSRSSGTCCMRRSDCDDYKNPNRNLQIQLNTDGPIKYVEVLGGDMLSQSQSFRSCMSPMSEYSDFTLIKPSSTTDFKEVISVLDASLPDSTWTFESQQDDSSQRLLIEIKDDGEPVQSATVTVSIQLEDGLHEPILDLRQKTVEPSKKTGRITLYLILSLASVSVLSLVTFLILAVKCMRNSRSSGTCCMRRSDCDDYKNPNRNLQIQLNTDGPIKYVEVLGGDMLSQSQSFRSCMSPMSEYSDFTLIKPSSTTDFKEVISVLDASLPDSTWTFESQQSTYSFMTVQKGEVRTKRAVSEQDDSSQRLLIEIKDDGEPVQSATVTVSIQLEDGLHEPILDLRQKAAEPSKKTGRITLYLILSLASVSVLSLVTFLILAVKCMRNSRSSGTCCMRRSDCDDYKNPNRNLQIQLNTDGPIKYVEVLGGDMLSQSQSFRSCMSPMSEYSDFTLIKPSSTTDFKEVISVLDASLPDSTWTFESQQVS
ncbi:hypothetical protein ABVT39_017495 [Epinephelus coioides]